MATAVGPVRARGILGGSSWRIARVSGIDIAVADPTEVVHRARARGVPAAVAEVELCGVRFHLVRAA